MVPFAICTSRGSPTAARPLATFFVAPPAETTIARALGSRYATSVFPFESTSGEGSTPLSRPPGLSFVHAPADGTTVKRTTTPASATPRLGTAGTVAKLSAGKRPQSADVVLAVHAAVLVDRSSQPRQQKLATLRRKNQLVR